jgi:hypothetical protein
MAHPLDEKNVKDSYPKRLQVLAKAWSKKWEGAYDHSQKCMRLWLSGYYDKGYSRWHMLNYMDRGVSTVTSYLVSGNPKVLVETLSPNLRQFAYSMRLILNFAIEQNKFADEVLIPGAVASMFGDCIARTFYEYDRAVSLDDETIKIGTPRVALIEPCDYIGDPSAKTRRDFAIEGDIYRLPTEYARDLFGKKYADHIKADCKLITKYSAEELSSKGFDFNKLADRDYTTFMDIVNIREGTIDTIMPMGHKACILKSMSWDGPDRSPYDVLGYRFAPNIPISVPPAWNWYDLDVSANIVAKAAREQAESQKTILAGEPIAKDAMKSVLSGKNMDMLLAKHADKIQKFDFGGVTADNYGWLQWAGNEFAKSGGGANPNLAGAGPAADTLGQEQMVMANATRVANNFYTQFHNWMTSVLRKWAWALMEDPGTYFEILDVVEVPGVGSWEYPVYFSSADKTAEFNDLVFNIVPYSTQRKSPEQKYAELFQFCTQWLLPTQPMREAQGASLDFETIDKFLADYQGIDSFPQWYRGTVPQDDLEVNFVMNSKSPGQMDDSLGATLPSRTANNQQQQARAGYGGETGNSLGGMPNVAG